MKTLTLHQPWATLIALGYKTVETRSWSTAYRGRVLIHAGQNHPPVDFRVGEWTMFRFNGMGPLTLGRSGDRNPDTDVLHDVPTGAIIASANLVDVLPIIHPNECEWHCEHAREVVASAHAAIDGQVILHRPDARMHTTVLVEEALGDYTRGRFAWVLEDVLPVGARCPACWGEGVGAVCPDSGTGRAGCNGSGRCAPIPAKGRQGLWDWTP